MALETLKTVSGQLGSIWEGVLMYAQETFFMDIAEMQEESAHTFWAEPALSPVKAYIPVTGNTHYLPPLWTLFNSELSHSNIKMHAKRLNRE